MAEQVPRKDQVGFRLSVRAPDIKETTLKFEDFYEEVEHFYQLTGYSGRRPNDRVVADMVNGAGKVEKWDYSGGGGSEEPYDVFVTISTTLSAPEVEKRLRGLRVRREIESTNLKRG